MDYPDCHLRCNGLLNCQQMENLISSLGNQNGREDTISIYSAMLKKNYSRCPFLREPMKTVASMYY